MGRIKVLIYLILFLVSNKVISQTNIDTISVGVRFPEHYLKAYTRAIYIEGTDTLPFNTDDLPNYTFKWTGDFTPALDSLPVAIYNYNTTGIYNVNLTVVEKSTSKTFFFSRTLNITPPPAIRVPSVFTPNGDGINDLFKVFYDGTTVMEIIVFNSSGIQVFTSKAPTIVWDGTISSGSIVSTGVYYYILTSDNPGIPVQKGFFHLYNQAVD